MNNTRPRNNFVYLIIIIAIGAILLTVLRGQTPRSEDVTLSQLASLINNGQVVSISQTDTEPAPATTAWPRDTVIRDQFFLLTPLNLPPGQYQLLVGFYPIGDPVNRLPITDPGETESVSDRALIQPLTIVP